MPDNDNAADLVLAGKKLCSAAWRDQSSWEGNHSAAIALFKKALALNPNDAAALTNLGAALSDMGKHREALEVLRKAEAIGSSDRNLYFNLAVALMGIDGSGRDEAQSMFEKAFTLEPEPNTMEAYLDPHGH